MTKMMTGKPIEIPTVDAIRKRLSDVGQEHLLAFYGELDAAGRESLLRQICAIELESLPELARKYVHADAAFALPAGVGPAPYYPLRHEADGGKAARTWDREHYRRVGRELISAGKVAAFVVAGGQGSRLGYEGPKGCFPAGAVSGKPLFAIFADALLGAQDRYGVAIPWYVMTSPLNHAQTIAFFERSEYFGLQRENVMFFQQGVMPTMDIRSGKVLLASKGDLATNPDGHGGSLRALWQSRAIDDMNRRGVEIISYFQVDNPIVNIIDPVFLGLHASAPDSSGEMSSKMVAKRDAAERVGVFCSHGAGPKQGRVEVIEYSDLPAELSEERNADGSLRYCAGSIAVHAIGVGFVEQLNRSAAGGGFALPFHRAEKKVACVDHATGASVQPAANNAVKLEAFVFDALPLCERSIVLEADRVEEFAPIKNASGSDSAASSARLQTERAARWLESLGVAVPRTDSAEPDCTLEVSPRTATTAAELRSAMGQKLPRAIERGASLLL